MNTNRPARSYLGLAILLSLHLVCGVIVLGLLLKAVPQYEKIFKDFGCQLPAMTIQVIYLSRTAGSYWYLLVPLLTAVDLAAMFSLNGAGRTGLMIAWGVLVWLAEMLLAGLILMAVIVPMNDLTLQLSK